MVTFSAVLFTCSVEAQTTWIVTVDVKGGNTTPTYQVTPAPGGTGDTCAPAPHNTQGTNGDVYVCTNDSVFWEAASKPDNQQKMHNHLIIGQEDAILDGTNDSTPIHIFHTPEGGKVGGAIDEFSDVGDYKYSVFVFDKVANGFYIDDPKIIIGGTNLEIQLVRLENALAPLLAEIAKDPKASEREKKLAAKVQNQINELKKHRK